MTSDLAARVAALEETVAALTAAAGGRGALDLAWPDARTRSSVAVPLGVGEPPDDGDPSGADGSGVDGSSGAGGPGRAEAADTESITGGEIGYQGTVRLHGHVEWAVRYAAASGVELPAQPASGVLAALGHPIRVALAQRLLQGPATTTELQEAAGLSSTGQLYHHMRSLTAAGVAEQDGRGTYRVPARAVVPTLVLLVAASDIAHSIATTSTG